ncbi:MAG: exo-beta-N-acetylmuramidase NamZ domain-containing protein, partial [Cyclobacteriaceae bacterium]
PNPNGAFVDGPIREDSLKSFVGMHPIPILHGLTVGELAQMINGEQWLENGGTCPLTVISLKNYSHNRHYSLPVWPSPNLPTDLAIKLYPSLCLFEGTVMSVGRGTPFPFQVLGFTDPAFGSFEFTPKSITGKSVNPKLKDQKCYGIDFRTGTDLKGFRLNYLLDFYKKSGLKEKFFIGSFNRLAGTKELKKQIIAGWDEPRIRESWEPALGEFKEMRKKYLLYGDG